MENSLLNGCLSLDVVIIYRVLEQWARNARDVKYCIC